MNNFLTSQADTTDCRLCALSIAGIYSPLVLILGAALFAF